MTIILQLACYLEGKNIIHSDKLTFRYYKFVIIYLSALDSSFISISDSLIILFIYYYCNILIALNILQLDVMMINLFAFLLLVDGTRLDPKLTNLFYNENFITPNQGKKSIVKLYKYYRPTFPPLLIQ